MGEVSQAFNATCKTRLREAAPVRPKAFSHVAGVTSASSFVLGSVRCLVCMARCITREIRAGPREGQLWAQGQTRVSTALTPPYTGGVCCRNQAPQIVGLKPQKLFSHHPGGSKSKIKEWAGLGPPRPLSRACRWPSSPSPHRVSASKFPSRKDVSDIGLGLT